MSEAKAAMRRSVLAGLRSMDSRTRAGMSRAVLARARSEPSWREASHVLAYHPMAEEVYLVPMLTEAVAAHGHVWLPRIQGDELCFHAVRSLADETVKGPFGILEPDPALDRLDAASMHGSLLVLTPGLAFDRSGRRLGRGKGYYDRFLRSLRASAPGGVFSLALAFSPQILPLVPADERDELVDIVVTDLESIVAADAAATGA